MKPTAESGYHRGPGTLRAGVPPGRRTGHGPRPASGCTGRIVMTGMDSRGRPRQAGRLVDDSMTRAVSGPGTADRNSSLLAVPVAFYGRTAHAAGTGDSRADRHRQLALCRAVAAACGARVTTEFFDEDCRADSPWRCRPQGRSLLTALSAPDRVAGTVVVADPWCLLPPPPGARRRWHPGSARIPAGAARASRLWDGDLLGREIRLARHAPDRPRRRAAPPPRRVQMNAALLDPSSEASAPVRRFVFKGRVSTKGQPGPRGVPELAAVPQPRPDRAGRRDHRRRVLRHRAVPLAAVDAPAPGRAAAGRPRQPGPRL